MNSKGNSNEFDLDNKDQKIQETPYKSLKTVKPKGYLNPLQMPFINAEQRRLLAESLEQLGGDEDV